jgi:uncharacterized membrane protein (UPF0127 family)
MKNFSLLSLGLIAIVAAIYILIPPIIQHNKVVNLQINERVIKAEVVDTPETQNLGLSYREKLDKDSGMLFIFDHSDRYGFWMKDMNFSIDIVWIDENFKIVGVEKTVAPETFPNVFYPQELVKYVLELPSGYVDQYHIAIGNMIQW